MSTQRIKIVRDARMEAHLGRLLFAMGLSDPQLRIDAGETASFTRELEFIRSRVYEAEYPEMKARRFIPIDSSVPAWADTFLDRQYDLIGDAKLGSDYGGDIPRADVVGKELARNIYTIVNGYAYSVQDLMRAARMREPLQTWRGKAARKAMERKLDSLAAIGDSRTGLVGFAKSTLVPRLHKASSPDVIVGDWTLSSTPANVLSDLFAICDQVFLQSKELHTSTTIILPTTYWMLISEMPYSATIPDTVLEVFKRARPGVTVESWTYLETADLLGTKRRIIAYEKSEENASLIIPQEFTQLPPQPQGFEFFVPCHMRFGGVAINRPIAMVYADIEVSA